jgi:hypothetical protein
MRTMAEPTSIPGPTPAAPAKVPTAAVMPRPSAPMAQAPSVAQPAGSRFRSPEAPTMAPRGTPATTRRLDKTP